jgi:hydrogenase maturation protease
MNGILVAGVGNIFNGDDAFGVEVAQRLLRCVMPDGVKVVDFGIRARDLAYALLDGYDAVVLIDTAARGEAPGTVSVIKVEPAQDAAAKDAAVSPHALDPAAALEFVHALGNEAPPVFLVACEPLSFGDEGGAIGLSAPVAAAVEPALAVVTDVVQRLRAEQGNVR